MKDEKDYWKLVRAVSLRQARDEVCGTGHQRGGIRYRKGGIWCHSPGIRDHNPWDRGKHSFEGLGIRLYLFFFLEGGDQEQTSVTLLESRIRNLGIKTGSMIKNKQTNKIYLVTP